MRRRRWTQAKLRSVLGAPTGLISRWLYGDRRPGVEWAYRIEQALKIRAGLWGAKPEEDFTPEDDAQLKQTGT